MVKKLYFQLMIIFAEFKQTKCFKKDGSFDPFRGQYRKNRNHRNPLIIKKRTAVRSFLLFYLSLFPSPKALPTTSPRTIYLWFAGS